MSGSSADGSYWQPLDPESIKKCLNNVAKELRKDQEYWEVFKVIGSAKVPVINAQYGWHQNRQFPCDITVGSGVGCEVSNMIAYLFSLQPQSVNLYHFVRVFFHYADLKFKRYTTMMLVMFFLQQKKLMPTIERMQDGFKGKYIGGEFHSDFTIIIVYQ